MLSRKTSLSLICALSLTISSLAHAQPETDLERARKLGVELRICLDDADLQKASAKERLRIQRTADKDACSIRMDATRRVATARETALLAERDELEKALKEAEEDAERSWYESPSFWFWTGAVVGVVGGATMTVGGLWTLSQLTYQPLRPALFVPAEE